MWPTIRPCCLWQGVGRPQHSMCPVRLVCTIAVAHCLHHHHHPRPPPPLPPLLRKAGKEGACKEVVRSVVDHMERNAGPGQRVPLFYLLDAVLAVRGPQGPVHVEIVQGLRTPWRGPRRPACVSPWAAHSCAGVRRALAPILPTLCTPGTPRAHTPAALSQAGWRGLWPRLGRGDALPAGRGRGAGPACRPVGSAPERRTEGGLAERAAGSGLGTHSKAACQTRRLRSGHVRCAQGAAAAQPGYRSACLLAYARIERRCRRRAS